ncbi:MAG: hypothetical protein FJ014_13385 [Chloroflexi bacterium]|nr:hypothetical protein [Chloroflexota bacterium]
MTRDQEAKLWETHDATDYLDEMEPVAVTIGPRPRNRCSVCSQVLLSRYVAIDLACGRAQLRQVRQLYCPAGHESRLAPEAQRLADAVELVLIAGFCPRQARSPVAMVSVSPWGHVVTTSVVVSAAKATEVATTFAHNAFG